MSLKDDIVEEINKQKKKHSGVPAIVLAVIRSIAPLVAFKSLPLSIIFFVITYAVEAIWGKENLKERAMPDKWLNKVCSSDEVSSEGILFLNKANQKKGFVSVEDALNFLDIEKKYNTDIRSEDQKISEFEIRKTQEEVSLEKAKIEENESISGSEALRRRAEKERRNFIDVDGLSKGLDQIAKSFDVEGGVDSLKRFAKNLFNNR